MDPNAMNWLNGSGGDGNQTPEQIAERAQQQMNQPGYQQQAQETMVTQKALDNLLAFYGLGGEMPIFLPHRHERFKIQVPLCVALLRKTQESDEGAVDVWDRSRQEENDVTDMQLQRIKNFSYYPLHIHECYDVELNRRKIAAKIRKNFDLSNDDFVTHGYPTDTPEGSAITTNKSTRFVVFIDQKQKSIVVCFRGSQTLTELMPDVLCDSTEYLGGSAHSGFLRVMLAMEPAIKTAVLKAVADNKCYSVVITGHGLGAGVAVLLTLHWRLEESAEEAFKGVDIQCLAFAPPPVYYREKPIPQPVMDNIIILIHNSDFIPRLSCASFNQLNCDLRTIDQSVANMNEAIQLIASQASPSERPTPDKLADLRTAIERNVQTEFITLTHPGTCYRVNITSRTELALQKIASDQLHTRIILTDSLFSDHLALEYEIAFKQKLAAGNYGFTD